MKYVLVRIDVVVWMIEIDVIILGVDVVMLDVFLIFFDDEFIFVIVFCFGLDFVIFVLFRNCCYRCLIIYVFLKIFMFNIGFLILKRFFLNIWILNMFFNVIYVI